MSRKKILWLVSWYPNKLSPFNGDFIKRHAEAVSIYHDVQVIYVIRDTEGVITKNVLIEESVKDGLAEKVVYYYNSPVGLSILDKYLSEKKYRKLFKQAVVEYIDKSGIPVLSHVHVGMKAGIIAYWLKKTKAVPYVISEHWTGFLQEADERIVDKPFYLKLAWEKVIANASGLSAVSKYLSTAIQKQFSVKQVCVIPNVVDTSIFFPSDTLSRSIRFIHISNLSKFKNPASIIEAFSIVQKLYPSAVLNVFGSEGKQFEKLVSELQLNENICFHTEVPQQQLAEFIRQSLALILYSSYETFGCVIIEANACGIPVIVSDIPVFYEIVTEGLNGLFAKANNPSSLVEKMIEMINTSESFNSNNIAVASSKYNYEKIGKRFSDWYSDIVLKS
jgi:glycosyltransferase involved in cell wall biosynthesis